MKFYVVDTNVALVANGKAPQANDECVLACIDELKKIIEFNKVVIDDALRIINEYMKKLSPSGQPGAGDAFMKWVWHNQANSEKCESVNINEDKQWGFSNFPKDPKLINFDQDDRKFVAVALASTNEPEVVNAVDSDWWDYRQVLNKNGVKLKFVCPMQFKNGT